MSLLKVIWFDYGVDGIPALVTGTIWHVLVPAVKTQWGKLMHEILTVPVFIC